jgi:hypothetical protein
MIESSSESSAGSTKASSSRISETPSAISPILLRTAYSAGFGSARLFLHVHRCWLWADAEESGLGWVEECVLETEAGISELLAEQGRANRTVTAVLQADPLSISGKDALSTVARAWKHIQDKWHGDDHVKFIERREQSEPEGLSSSWEEQNSILRDPIWSELRDAIAGFVCKLPNEFAACWTTGSLIAQVLQLSRDSDGRQLAIVGEELPIPILQERLIDLQRKVTYLNGIDFEITKPPLDRIRFDWSDAKHKTRKLHTKILARLDRAARSPLDSSLKEQTQIAITESQVADELPTSSGDRNPGTPVDATGAQYVFQRNVRGWRLKFGGDDTHRLPDLVGLFYIHFLVTQVGEPFSGTALRGERYKFSGDAIGSAVQQAEIPLARDVAPVSAANNRMNELVEKRENLARVQARLTEVNNELEDAAEFRNEEKASQLQKEKEQLEDHLKKATAIGGKIRLESNQAKNDRDAVIKAIKLAFDIVLDERAATHFKKSIPLTDKELCYKPEHPINWRT